MYIFLTQFYIFMLLTFNISFNDFLCYFIFSILLLIEDPPKNHS